MASSKLVGDRNQTEMAHSIVSIDLLRCSLDCKLGDSWLGAFELCSVVIGVEELLLSLQSSIVNMNGFLVESLRVIEVVSVTGSELVRVQVFLIHPVGSVPELAIAAIPRSQRVRSLVDLEFGTRLEGQRVVAVSPVWSVMLLWVQIAVTRCGGAVALWLVVWG